MGMGTAVQDCFWSLQTPAIMVCTGATGQESPDPPHFQPLLSLGFKQTKQKSLPHLQSMCLQASVCSISEPQNTHARQMGHPSTPPIFLVGHSRRVLRRLSSPEHSAFPSIESTQKSLKLRFGTQKIVISQYVQHMKMQRLKKLENFKQQSGKSEQ